MQNLDFKTYGYLPYITIHDLRDWAHNSRLLQCSKYLKTDTILPSGSLYTSTTSCWMQILTLIYFRSRELILSYYLGVVDHYNKEKVKSWHI